MNVSILYRGNLSSCNFDCEYCPFAKHWESPEELIADRAGLTRFTDWVKRRRQDQFGIFFTPWGEALVRSWYRTSVAELSCLPQVRKVAVQTNLSCPLQWLEDVDVTKLGLWCTFHPTETSLDEFLVQCRKLDASGVAYSVGCVGLREHLDVIEQLRAALPPQVYVWVNAFKSQPNYYDDLLQKSMTAVDPLFPVNNTRHASRGHVCQTGYRTFTVDGHGDIRRCHFVDEIIGNIYEPGFEQALAPRQCPNETCGCHIGYVHLERLKLYPIFGDGLLERIPAAGLLERMDGGRCG